MYGKANEAVTNSGYTNICFTINGPLKMLPLHFRYCHFFKCKMTFDKNFMKKLPCFYEKAAIELLPSFYYVAVK